MMNFCGQYVCMILYFGRSQVLYVLVTFDFICLCYGLVAVDLIYFLCIISRIVMFSFEVQHIFNTDLADEEAISP